jgi:hypothetical protein
MPDPAELPNVDDDPILEARIQHALRPYHGRLTPAALAEARRMLALILTTNPRTAALLERIRQSGAPGSSGVVASSGGAGAAAVTEAKKVG